MNRIVRSFLGFACFLGLATASFGDEKDFHDQDLKEKNFDNQILNSANFADAILQRASFQKASLKKANFRGADITNANFNGADLTEADFRDVKHLTFATGATFYKTNLEGITLDVMYGTSYRGALLGKAVLMGISGDNDFSNADLRGANLRGFSINGNKCRFKNAIYDEDTAWPEGFDPVAAGAVMQKAEAAK